MKKFLASFYIAILGLGLASAAPVSADSDLPQANSLLTILCYHNIDLLSPKNSPYSVTTQAFVDQLKALKSAGFEFVSLRQIESFYLKGAPLPTRSALITFDDGHQNIFEHAYPVLKKMNIPWMLFVFPTAIGGGHEKGYMDWTDVRTLYKDGVAIGSHSFDHPYLTRPDKEINTPAAYGEWLKKELVHSKKLIEEKLSVKVTTFASPFGALNDVVQRYIGNSGYSLAFNVFGSNNDYRTDPLQLNRIIVLANDTPETVVKKAEESPLHFGKLLPGSLKVISGQLNSIVFTLDRFKDYVPGSIHVLLNGAKPDSFTRAGSSFNIGFTAPDHTKGYIVTVYARKKTGESCSQSYYFIYAASKPGFLG
jgi:peptidoglycan/xylan/chitin deacetylase (PgdA/CDA1 family)